jgi:hypothetical protein
MKRKAAIPVLCTLLAVASVSLAQKGGARRASPCKDWKAWHNVMPGTSPAKLHVTATCQFPTAGYSVELVSATAGAQKAPVYVLTRVVHKPKGMVAQVITEVLIDYSVETSVEYKTVLIKPERKRIPVETVH